MDKFLLHYVFVSQVILRDTFTYFISNLIFCFAPLRDSHANGSILSKVLHFEHQH